MDLCSVSSLTESELLCAAHVVFIYFLFASIELLMLYFNCSFQPEANRRKAGNAFWRGRIHNRGGEDPVPLQGLPLPARHDERCECSLSWHLPHSELVVANVWSSKICASIEKAGTLNSELVVSWESVVITQCSLCCAVSGNFEVHFGFGSIYAQKKVPCGVRMFMIIQLCCNYSCMQMFMFIGWGMI